MIFKTNIFFQLQDSNVLKKEIDRWKEEVKIQEAKGSLNASKLKSEMEAHQVCIDYVLNANTIIHTYNSSPANVINIFFETSC